MTAAPSYILGHADPEIERLQPQASVVEGVTRRMIRECGIVPGMRVLDIGCGAADVSMLLADAVGPSGKVVAIDREQRAIELGRDRAERAGYRQIEFVLTSDEAVPDGPPFDAAIGRFILVHQIDPATMIRRAAAAVRPGWIIAFHEAAIHILAQIAPAGALHETLVNNPWPSFFKAAFPSRDAARRLVACFEEAGLPMPHLIWEAIVGGHNSAVARWHALNIRSVMSIFPRLGRAPLDFGDLETLPQRLAAQMADVKAQIVSMPQSCA